MSDFELIGRQAAEIERLRASNVLLVALIREIKMGIVGLDRIVLQGEGFLVLPGSAAVNGHEASRVEA